MPRSRVSGLGITSGASFFDLEPSDTDPADHYRVRLNERYGVEYRFSGPLAEGV